MPRIPVPVPRGSGRGLMAAVHISGLAEPSGSVGRSRFAGASGSAMEGSTARVQWQPAVGRQAMFKVAADATEIVIGLEGAR